MPPTRRPLGPVGRGCYHYMKNLKRIDGNCAVYGLKYAFLFPVSCFHMTNWRSGKSHSIVFKVENLGRKIILKKKSNQNLFLPVSFHAEESNGFTLVVQCLGAAQWTALLAVRTRFVLTALGVKCQCIAWLHFLLCFFPTSSSGCSCLEG